jgi:hypothetical protein
MSLRIKRWPSVGFWFLLTSWFALVGFMSWGYTQPELDRVWGIEQRMKRADFGALTPNELATLKDALDRHPDLSRAFSGRRLAGFVEPTQEGWQSRRASHLVLRSDPDKKARIWVECRGAASAYPVRAKLAGSGFSQELEFERAGRQHFDLAPGRLPKPVLLSVTVRPTKQPASGQAPVRISIDEEVGTAGGAS